MSTNSGFTASNVEWQYTRSKTIGSNDMVRTGIKQLDVVCNACGHAWTARRYGPGKFSPAIGKTLLECPSCGKQDAIAGKDL
jgi:hypothetical protein